MQGFLRPRVIMRRPRVSTFVAQLLIANPASGHYRA